MFLQVIFVFEGFLAIFAQVVGRFGMHQDHVAPHVGPLFREFPAKRTPHDCFACVASVLAHKELHNILPWKNLDGFS